MGEAVSVWNDFIADHDAFSFELDGDGAGTYDLRVLQHPIYDERAAWERDAYRLKGPHDRHCEMFTEDATSQQGFISDGMDSG